MIGDDEDDAALKNNGFFKPYHINVLKRLDHKALLGISVCRNDEERLVFVNSLSYVHNMPDLMATSMAKPTTKWYRNGKKSKAAAQKKRAEGNRAFQLKDYPKAVRLYSAAILQAPAGSAMTGSSNNQGALHSIYATLRTRHNRFACWSFY